MEHDTSPIRDATAQRRRAILCVLAASATFTLGAAFIKALTEHVPVFEIVMVRSYVAFLAMVPVLWRAGGISAMRTNRPWGHVLRTVFGFFGTFTTVYGFAYLPIVTVTALGFAMPLFLTILSVPLLGERVGWRRASAVVIGLGGVMIMLRPWDGFVDAAEDPLAVSLVLAGVVTWALAMITIRKMGEVGEKNVTIVAWFTLGTAVMATVCAIPGWVTPSPTHLAMMVAAGIMSGVAQLLMTEGYRSGDTTVVAPFEYGAIVYATILGMVLWGEYPDHWMLLGIVILVGAGLYIWRREASLGLRK